MKIIEVLNDSEGVMWEVESSQKNIYYIVNVFFDERGWYCNCPDHYYRKHDCKHIRYCKEVLLKMNAKTYLDDVQANVGKMECDIHG